MRFAHRSLLALALLPALSTASAEGLVEPLAGAGATPPAPWRVVGLPQQTKPYTRFSTADVDGRRGVRIEADRSYGNLVHPLKATPAPLQLSWQWRVEVPLTQTDLHEKSGDDTQVKVCVFFDEPLDKVPFVERQLLAYGRSKASEPIPTATVCYVWDARLAPGTTIENAFTRRLRYIVLQGGGAALDRWVAERRDVGADFLKVFGAECPTVPPVTGVAVGADADNTKSRSVAYVSELKLQ